jgi:hypothetical protein
MAAKMSAAARRTNDDARDGGGCDDDVDDDDGDDDGVDDDDDMVDVGWDAGTVVELACAEAAGGARRGRRAMSGAAKGKGRGHNDHPAKLCGKRRTATQSLLLYWNAAHTHIRATVEGGG